MPVKTVTAIAIFLSIILLQPSCRENATGPANKFLSWPPKNIDTTSHNFTWEIDTLEYPGAFQILPNGIWGADTNDVWMVAHSDDWKARIWHWDGKNWTAWAGGALGVSPNDIIGFSKDDIWLAGRRIGNNPEIKTIRHWDGRDWNIVEHNIPTHIMSIWGSSSDNMYFGLIDGRIVHYNGVTFRIDNTQTNAQILDIHGILEDEIFATGIQSDTVQPFDSTGYYIFKYDKNEWKINNYFLKSKGSLSLTLPIRGLWSFDFGYLFGVNRFGVYVYNGNDWLKIYQISGTLTLAGTNINNIFTAGYPSGSSIYHFNGITWKSYHEFENIDLVSWSLYVLENKVFIPGYTKNKAYIIRGRRRSN